MSRALRFCLVILLLTPGPAFAQKSPDEGSWVPPRDHSEALRRAQRDLALLDHMVDRRQEDPWYRLQRLRVVYFLGIEDETFLPRVDGEAAQFRRFHPQRPGVTEASLRAYEGAAEVLRGKHALWPLSKARHLRTGLAVLDSLVAAHPRHAEVRYLRLISTAYLPFIFGRGDSTREDASVLAELLDDARASFPGPTFVAMTDVLLEAGRLDPRSRAEVEGLRRRVLDATPAEPLAALSPPSSSPTPRPGEPEPGTTERPGPGG